MSSQIDPIIQVEGLVKKFGNLTAVDGISFSVQKGEIFGIIGPNGAGKTTTLEIIEGLQTPTSGSVKILGLHQDPSNAPLIKERIGVQLQASTYFDHLTLTEILHLFGSFYRARIPPHDLLARVDLIDKASTTIKKLSGGQKQRFSIVASLVNDPDLIILDEPTTGLDPAARRSLWDLIRNLHNAGKTIVLTTHYMEEAQFLCSRVAIIDHGKIIALDTVPNLVQRIPAPYRVVLTTSMPLQLTPATPDQWSLESIDSDGLTLHLRMSSPASALPALTQLAGRQNAVITRLEVIPATLEDVILELTGTAPR
ncbi:MAG: ABC transporter ATP-binding protein [SAR202 cluster bacterium]|nr:ABC transporter ATP-binding protein [SAR202 cluster bacterium]